MLHRRMLSVPLLLLLVTTTGCTYLRFIDNSPPEEIQKFETSKEELWNQVKALEHEKAGYLQHLADKQAEIGRMYRNLKDWQIARDQADQRVSALNKTIESLNAQIKQRQETGRDIPAPAKGTVPEGKSVEIKVLAGNGKIASARSLSKQLEKMGYRVRIIDQAPRSDFKVNTVFFGAGYRAAAMTLAKQLGKEAVTKPLSWPSIFNIIVVTGTR